MIIRLKDGTQDVIFTPEDFNHLVRDKLGDDAGNYIDNRIQELQNEADYTLQAVNTDLECFESSLGSNNACFCDLLDNLSKLEEIIKKPKVIKDQALNIINQMEHDISNQL